MKTYYDHDPIWAQRDAANNPVWGSYSHVVYSQVIEQLGRLKLSEKLVLDVGCGAGAFGRRLMDEGYRYFGVDASSVAIALGRKHFQEVPLETADFTKQDLRLVHAAASFPVITCINVLHCLIHDEERQQMLSNMRDYATIGGFLVLTTMVGPVDQQHQDQRSPRAYFPVTSILQEVASSGWNPIHHEVEAPRRENLAGNILLVAQR